MNPDIASLPLRDIHLPETVPWWPLAPGWWILLGLLVSVTVLVVLLRYLKKRKRFSKLVMYELNQITTQYESDKDSKKLLMGLSGILRRVSITAFPDRNPAAMTGEDWLKFLDDIILQLSAKPMPSLFCSPLGKPLITAPYQKHIPVNEQETQKLLTLCREWIQLVTRRVHPSTKSGVYV